MFVLPFLFYFVSIVGLVVEAAAAKAKEKEESKRATSLYKLRQLITDEKIARTGNKSDHKEKSAFRFSVCLSVCL